MPIITKIRLSLPNLSRHVRAIPTLASGGVLLALLVLTPAPLRAQQKGSDCVWGQPGYRDCVDKLLEEQKKKDAKAAASTGAAAETAKTAAADGSAAQPGKTTAQPRKAKTTARTRRPGAGSLDPVPPAELRLTNPNTDRLEDAIMTLQRERQMDNNRLRYDRPVPSPIMPPNYSTTPNNGRICPSWGC